MNKRLFGGLALIGLIGLLPIPVFALTVSQTNISLAVGSNTTVSTGGYVATVYVFNSMVANVTSIGSSSIVIAGISAGNTDIRLCDASSSCSTIFVTVTGSSSSGITLSQTNLSLNSGQSGSVTIYGGYSSYTATSSNTNVASVSVSSSTLYVYANNFGSATISVCPTYWVMGTSCASLYVTVSSGYSPLTLTTASLPQMAYGTYYSFQFGASGGTAPYSFTISSGSLPSGLSLSSSGLISGYPAQNSSGSFTVRVSDTNGQTTSKFFYLGGRVLGTMIYLNGTLVNDGGTVFITYKNMKSGFANLSAFLGLGYKLSNVAPGGTSALSNTNYVISSSSIPHPWGSWVINGQTIYFAHQDGLIPIPSFSIFENNGGMSGLVVQANSFDLARPVLPAMIMQDSRLLP